MKRLGRDAAELTALADHLTARGLVLEMLAGPPPGTYDPSGPGRLLLFAFFAAMAETERENIRESTLEGLDAAARKGRHAGRPPVIIEDTLSTVPRRRANGQSVSGSSPTGSSRPASARGRPRRRGHPPGARRAREAGGVPRSRRPDARRLRRSPGHRRHPSPPPIPHPATG
ncbi:recombinase family protein [Streptomyces sp. SP18CS02]|uniref:recombinase family protein n=1 Tax=Streptomyces sp. SP18CS02 TaxID=3002531 RepID=UPI002E77135E|nr:recombinase family protein [Streptomyces sp. SP18CS02]MEE1751979.1 recombinase family protein [Streptomyces sp. SP18CS02]